MLTSGDRICALDCGTNTVLLTIAESRGGRLVPVVEHAEITRLGEGLARTGEIAAAALERTAAVFDTYAKIIGEQQCRRVLAVGTEALRRATNGAAAVARLNECLAVVGASLELIDGPREAALSYGAVTGSFPELHGPRTVVDIGGGSTEIVVGDAEGHFDGEQGVVSIKIGSVVLTEELLPTDPPTASEKDALVKAIDAALASAPPLRGTVVGIAGTVTTFAAISLGLRDYDATKVHGLVLTKTALDKEVERIGALRVDDRRRTPGLQPKRADVIYAGGVILSRVLARAGATECLVSDRGVRWGLLYEVERRASFD